MMNLDKLLLYCIIFLFFVNVFSAEEKNTRPVLENADRGYGELVDNQQVWNLFDNVRFRQDSVIMLCDKAIRYMDEERTLLIGNVQIFDSSKTLYGDQVDYYEPQKLALVKGNVKFVDSTKTFTSDFLKYFQDSEILIADSNVVISDNVENSTLTGAHMEYHREDGYAKLLGEPVFTRVDTVEDAELLIAGELMEMFHDGDSILVKENVSIHQGEISAFGDSLKYLKDAQKVVLESFPYAFENEDKLTGEAIHLYLVENKVRRIHVIGNSIVTTLVDTPVVTTIPYNLLTGDEIWVKLKEQKIDSVNIIGKATSYYHIIEDNAEKGINKILCDELLILFADNMVKKVYGSSKPGMSTGQFSPPGNKKKLEQELREMLQKLEMIENKESESDGTNQ